MTKIILASASPRRKYLLGKLGIPFKKTEGDFTTIIGFPIPALIEELKNFGIII